MNYRLAFLIGLSLAAAVVVLAGIGPPGGTIVIVPFLLLAPGGVLVDASKIDGDAQGWLVAIGLSLGIGTVVAETFLYLGAMTPMVVTLTLVAFTLVAATTLVLLRRRDARLTDSRSVK